MGRIELKNIDICLQMIEAFFCLTFPPFRVMNVPPKKGGHSMMIETSIRS